MTKWEYSFHDFYGGVVAQERATAFNEFGADGWELVCISPQGTYIFKREFFPSRLTDAERAAAMEEIRKTPLPDDPIAAVESVPIYKQEPTVVKEAHLQGAAGGTVAGSPPKKR